MRRVFVYFAFLLLLVVFCIFAKAYKDIFHYRDVKSLMILKIADHPFLLEVPVLFCRSFKKGPFIHVETEDGLYGMCANTKGNKVYFFSGKAIFGGIFNVTYEVTDLDSEKKLLEILQTHSK